MKTHRIWSGWLAVFALACWLVSTGQALAVVAPTTQTYTFTGDCGDCTGTGIGTLTLTGYTLGDTLQTSNVVSFSYDSNLISYSYTASDVVYVSGGLPAALPGGLSQLYMQFGSGQGMQFYSNVEYWCTGASCAADYGYSGSWTQAASVPEPASMAVLGGGLVALAGMRRRRA